MTRNNDDITSNLNIFIKSFNLKISSSQNLEITDISYFFRIQNKFFSLVSKILCDLSRSHRVLFFLISRILITFFNETKTTQIIFFFLYSDFSLPSVTAAESELRKIKCSTQKIVSMRFVKLNE